MVGSTGIGIKLLWQLSNHMTQQASSLLLANNRNNNGDKNLPRAMSHTGYLLHMILFNSHYNLVQIILVFPMMKTRF